MLRAVPWQCRLRCGVKPGARPSRRGPPGLFVDRRLCTVLPGVLARPLAVRFDRPQNVAGVGWPGFKEVSYYHRCRPAGPENRARRTPSWGGASARSPKLGVGAFRRRGTVFRSAACCSHRCGPWGLWIGSPRRGVSMDLLSIRGKGR